MIDVKNTATVGRSTTRHIVTPNTFSPNMLCGIAGGANIRFRMYSQKASCKRCLAIAEKRNAANS